MNLKLKFILLISYCFSIVGYAQAKKQIPPKTYIAYKAINEIEIDGDFNEISWKNISWTDNFIDIKGIKKPTYNTKVKMLWDKNYFYILAKIEEPHVWADIKKHDAIIFHNNDFELFVDPDGDGHNYYEVEINALNTVWDLFISKPYRELNQPILNDWHATGMKSAIKVDGTLNNPNDIDKGWVVEMAIPWDVYKTSYFHKNVPENKFWRINFSRVHWDFQIVDGIYERKKNKKEEVSPEYNWVWSPQGVVNMHQPEKWGYVYFSSKKPGQKDSFSISNDEKIKWRLFELYRKQKAYYQKNQQWITRLEKLMPLKLFVENKEIKAILETHSLGWNIIVNSPFSQKKIMIREDGKLTIK